MSDTIEIHLDVMDKRVAAREGQLLGMALN